MPEFMTMRVPAVAPLREDNRRANALSRDPRTVSFQSGDPAKWQDVLVNGVVVGIRNVETGQVVANRYILDLRNRERRLENDRREEEEESNRGGGGRGSRGGNGGGSSGAGGGLVQASGPSGGAGSNNSTASGSRIDAMNQMVAAGVGDLVDPAGLLTDEAQAALVEGLNLGEISDGLLSLLDPENFIRFQVESVDGRTYYTNAQLLTPDEIEQETSFTANAMNYPTAYQYFELGYLIARSSWADEYDDGPRRFLARMGGIDFDVTLEGQTPFRIGEDATLTKGDYLATDWVLVDGCAANLPEREPFPVDTEEVAVPLIDVLSPPCRVAA
jgi:hypothetical protein